MGHYPFHAQSIPGGCVRQTDRQGLIIPFSADGSSKRAVRAVLALLYGVSRVSGTQQSEFFLRSTQYRLTTPEIYCYIGNRLTQMNGGSAAGFRSVVNAIGE